MKGICLSGGRPKKGADFTDAMKYVRDELGLSVTFVNPDHRDASPKNPSDAGRHPGRHGRGGVADVDLDARDICTRARIRRPMAICGTLPSESGRTGLH